MTTRRVSPDHHPPAIAVSEWWYNDCLQHTPAPYAQYAGVFTERDPGAVQTMLCVWGVLTSALFLQTLRMNAALGMDAS